MGFELQHHMESLYFLAYLRVTYKNLLNTTVITT